MPGKGTVTVHRRGLYSANPWQPGSVMTNNPRVCSCRPIMPTESKRCPISHFFMHVTYTPGPCRVPVYCSVHTTEIIDYVMTSGGISVSGPHWN